MGEGGGVVGYVKGILRGGGGINGQRDQVRSLGAAMRVCAGAIAT